MFYAVLFDIIKKFPDFICLKVIDNVHGYRIVKEEMKAPKIKICGTECKNKFPYHS